VISLGVGLASVAKSLSDERLARRSLHERLKQASELESFVASMQAAEKLVREDARVAQESLDAAREELGKTNAANATLAASLGKTKDKLAATEAELQAMREQLKSNTKNLQGSEQALVTARAEAARLNQELRRAEVGAAQVGIHLTHTKKVAWFQPLSRGSENLVPTLCVEKKEGQLLPLRRGGQSGDGVGDEGDAAAAPRGVRARGQPAGRAQRGGGAVRGGRNAGVTRSASKRRPLSTRDSQ
jgi:multidrug efflux pump subunit AcrA (membrane-fusion protein)